jgi:D-alanyl-D-alanine carboxypeptidase
VLLGMVIETVSGEPFGSFCRRRLFGPAGLVETAVDDAATIVPGRASGYTPNSAAASGFDNSSFISMTLPGAAGAIRSTTDDLCRWHAALLDGRVVRSESLREMMTPVRLHDGTLPMGTLSPVPNAPPIVMEYGFGLWMGTFKGKRFVGHVGNINGFSSQLRSFPAEKISVACLFNCDLWGEPASYAEMESLRDAAASLALGVA